MRNLESNLQSACVRWFRLQYPNYSPLFFAVPNGGARNRLEAIKLKREGVLAGVSDLILLLPTKSYPFLCIEMKTYKGRQSKPQRNFQKEVEKRGGKYIVCKSIDSFMEAINEYVAKDELWWKFI